jgi:hypothetical protein
VSANVFEIHINRLYVDDALLEENGRHIDPARWKPLVMSFCRFFGHGGEVHPSRPAESEFMRFVRRGTGAAQPTAAPDAVGAPVAS